MTARRGASPLAWDVQLATSRAEILKALGHPVRLRIVAHLCDAEEMTVGEIGAALRLPQSSVSQQLASLRLNGLVSVRKEGGFRYYALAIPKVRDLIECLSTCGREQR